ncbi:MAG: hypothetical protein Q9224_006625 [Gallowayella concinna]
MQRRKQILATSSQQTPAEPLTDDDKDFIACIHLHVDTWPEDTWGALKYAPNHPNDSAILQSPRRIDDGDVESFIGSMQRSKYPEDHKFFSRWKKIETEKSKAFLAEAESSDIEIPEIETPDSELSEIETSNTEIPKIEISEIEASATKTPKFEASVTETPEIEASVTQAAKPEEPLVEMSESELRERLEMYEELYNAGLAEFNKTKPPPRKRRDDDVSEAEST